METLQYHGLPFFCYQPSTYFISRMLLDFLQTHSKLIQRNCMSITYTSSTVNGMKQLIKVDYFKFATTLEYLFMTLEYLFMSISGHMEFTSSLYYNEQMWEYLSSLHL